jgi:hypothetical protein
LPTVIPRPLVASLCRDDSSGLGITDREFKTKKIPDCQSNRGSFKRF